MTYAKLYRTTLSVSVVFLLAAQAYAVPTQVVHIETPQCDVLSIPTDVHEIGDFTEFPSNEALSSADIGSTFIGPCAATDDPTTPDAIVDIRNLSGIAWKEVWYVADQETNITNFDGEANDILSPSIHEAFRIDYLISDPGGSHHPLLSESMTADGIWEPGESWQFVLQDYTNTLGLPPSAITSIGVGTASGTPATGIIDSSGSIIAVAIPEPTTFALFSVSILAGGLRSRR